MALLGALENGQGNAVGASPVASSASGVNGVGNNVIAPVNAGTTYNDQPPGGDGKKDGENGNKWPTPRQPGISARDIGIDRAKANQYVKGYGGGTGTGEWPEELESDPEMMQQLYNADAAAQVNQELLKASGLEAGPAKVDRVEHVDTHPEEEMLKQITDAAQQQAELQVNNAVQTGTTQLQRNMQDAQEQYQVAKDQIDIDEQRALDNQALYSEARGDRGGIGQAQYNTIQNTAATNRLTVQNEQTKLATDTARQITDLRAQGEFEKANQLLSITQNYLGQLMNLYQWAKETNLGVDEFNIQVSEWEENYKLSVLGANLDIANATGVFSNGTPTFNTWAKTQELLAAAGQALLERGIAPTTEQLAAMGMTAKQAEQYVTGVK